MRRPSAIIRWRSISRGLKISSPGKNTDVDSPQRYYIWKDRQAEAQSNIWTDPQGYYFLNIMVVHPDAQGRGIGKALAKEVTSIADAEGKRCYLESSRDVPNMKIYETFGFHFEKKMVCDDEGDTCNIYCMTREPQTDSKGSKKDV